MTIQCKTCGSNDVVVACDKIMPPKDDCVFLCLNCRAAFLASAKNSSKKGRNHWVILFVQVGSEEKLTEMLQRKLSLNDYLPFVPMREAAFRRQSITQIIRKPLFPGYVFLQTEMDADLIADHLRLALDDIKELKHVYSILHYGNNRKDVVVREEEQSYWERLFDKNFCIPGSIGKIEGGFTRVTSGALMGLEQRIKKINRHKREAVIEMPMMESTREITVMLEIVEKT